LEQITIGVSANGVYTATSTLHPRLSGGTPYWLVVTAGNANSYAGWNLEYNFPSGPTAPDAANLTGIPTGPWTSLSIAVPLPAFQIDGNPVSVPEPSTLTLLGSAGLTVASYSWRRRQQAVRKSAMSERTQRPVLRFLSSLAPRHH